MTNIIMQTRLFMGVGMLLGLGIYHEEIWARQMSNPKLTWNILEPKGNPDEKLIILS